MVYPGFICNTRTAEQTLLEKTTIFTLVLHNIGTELTVINSPVNVLRVIGSLFLKLSMAMD